MILVTGGGGQLGRALARLGACAVPHAELPVDVPTAVARALDELRPDAVINAAAFTDVDRAEAEPEAAWRVNLAGALFVARACALRGVPLAHLSTDHVFDGSKTGPWVETDPTGPLNVYGKSKLAGERVVLSNHPAALVVRTSWVFSDAGTGFVGAILAQARAGGPLRVVDDQRGCPTPAADLARAVLALLERGAAGVVHFCGAGATTRRGFAEAIVAAAGLDVRIEGVAAADNPAPARRPLNGVLDTARAVALGVAPAPWRDALVCG